MEKQLSEKLPRVEVVDALRGFAVMAILLVHSLEHFIFPVYPCNLQIFLCLFLEKLNMPQNTPVTKAS